MNIELGTRTAETAEIYFYKSQQPFIKAVLPQKAKTVEEALRDYRNTLLPDATGYGRTITADNVYVGDVWCYSIDKSETPQAMLSYCVFDTLYQNKGIATAAVAMFLDTVKEKFSIRTIGAFTFSDNLPSIKVLDKNGFLLVEEFYEDGRKSMYLQREL